MSVIFQYRQSQRKTAPMSWCSGEGDQRQECILYWGLSSAMSLSFVYMKTYIKLTVYVHCWQSPFSALFIYSALLKHNLIIDKVVTYEVKEFADYYLTPPPFFSFYIIGNKNYLITSTIWMYPTCCLCSEFECTAANERCGDKSPQNMWCSQISIICPNIMRRHSFQF